MVVGSRRGAPAKKKQQQRVCFNNQNCVWNYKPQNEPREIQSDKPSATIQPAFGRVRRTSKLELPTNYWNIHIVRGLRQTHTHTFTHLSIQRHPSSCVLPLRPTLSSVSGVCLCFVCERANACVCVLYVVCECVSSQ